jgi:hypothetical protein
MKLEVDFRGVERLIVAGIKVQRVLVPRSSVRPASSRGHWAMGRPPGHSGFQVGEPLLVRV